MWASSWATTSATSCRSCWVEAFGIDEEQVLAERDAAEILHRSGGEVGKTDQVDLVGRVVDVVVLLEPPEAEGPDVETELRQSRLARDVDDAERDPVDVDRVGHLEAPDDERDQVRAHDHRVGESDHGSAVGARPLDLGTVRDRGQPVFDVEGDPEHRLERGLVPARERPSTVGRLHLRRRDDVLDAVVVGVGAAVEAAQLVVEDPA